MSTLYLCGAGNAEGVRLALAVQRAHGRWDRIVILDDDDARHGESILGVPIEGGFDLLAGADPRRDAFVNLVARTTGRRAAARERIGAFDVRPASLVHPDVDTDGVTLEEEVTVYRHAVLGAGARLGEGSVVFMGAILGHGASTGRHVVLAPGAVVNARVTLGEGVYVGTNASIAPDLTVGAWSTIGACSMATLDVPERSSVLGVPGRAFPLAGRDAPDARRAPAPAGGRP